MDTSQPPPPPDDAAARSRAGVPRDVLRRLAGRTASGRYAIEEEVARGGQGIVLRVRDEDLDRDLAMKLLGSPGNGEATDVPERSLGRFLDEARVTSQLDHPGIVPVHELGLDGDGRLFFTMKLVRGRTLREVFEDVQAGRDGWTLTRALGVLLKVCEALAYAHAKGVVHRDLKPSNVMVGRFGEVYVMDWGLARVMSDEERRLRASRPVSERTDPLHSRRREAAAGETGSPLVTVDGSVVGTAAYMSPEQAAGQHERLSPQSDVYSLGGMLYHLLTGQAPYTPPGVRGIGAKAVLEQLRSGPPVAVASLAPRVPAELVAICEKAMARAPADRYADTGALAEDLRAYLEQRVVSAYEGGAVAELRKWVARNRALAAACGAGLLLLVAGLTSSLVLKGQSDANAALAAEHAETADRKREEAEANLQLARENALLAQSNAEQAHRERAAVLRLSAFRRLEDLQQEARRLWPIGPELGPAFRDWLGRADALLAGLDPDPSGTDVGHRAQLLELRQRALPPEPGEGGHAPAAGTGGAPDGTIATAALDTPGDDDVRTWRFASEQDAWWHDQLVALVQSLEAFADEETGLLWGRSPEYGWGGARRLHLVAEVEVLTLTGEEARSRWSVAIASIADPASCPAYDGLEVVPQFGLLPIARQPDTGLWEFWHVLSGDEPARDEEGRLVMEDASGIVLVLVPGGSGWLGAQRDDPEAPHHDPDAFPHEGPPRRVDVSPYFLSKYEMTQGQWARTTGRNPAGYAAGRRFDPQATATLLHPVETVSWRRCREVVTWLGLTLPTEDQWEWAARAGTSTPWWTGADRESLEAADAVNLADETARRAGAPWPAILQWPGLEDGWVVHAPVDAKAANPFGLHHVHGNVSEWTRTATDPTIGPGRDLEPGETEGPKERIVYRGGSYGYSAVDARSSMRDVTDPDDRANHRGLRPARRLDG